MTTPCEHCQGRGYRILERDGRRVAVVCTCQASAPASPVGDLVPERFLECTFKDFKIMGKQQLAAQHSAEEFARTFPAVKHGLLFVGPSGTGKTHLAVSILKEVRDRTGVSGLFTDFSNFSFRIQGVFSSGGEETVDEIMEPILRTPLLVLDGLGSIRTNAFFLDVLFEIINQRYLARRHMVITTVYHPEAKDKDSLTDRLNDSIASRLMEMCLLVEMIGKDNRREMVQPRYKK